jgi:hypothetical protein
MIFDNEVNIMWEEASWPILRYVLLHNLSGGSEENQETSITLVGTGKGKVVPVL